MLFRSEKNSEAMMWLIKNKVLLNKLGRSLVDTVISMSVEDYALIREKVEVNIKGLNNRPLNTAINIAAGIEIFNLLLAKHGINQFDPITNADAAKVVNNIFLNFIVLRFLYAREI